MKIEIVPYSMDNYGYLIVCQNSSVAAAVDPGEGYPFLLALEKLGVRPVAVLCTHHHADHVGDISMLLNEFPELEVYCHDSDIQRIKEANSPLADGDCFTVGELEFTAIHTPGHTHGSVVYRVENNLFVGDTLFGGGCGRLFEGTAEQMFSSLEKIQTMFPPETKIYFGHEYTRKNLEFAGVVEGHNELVQQRYLDCFDVGGGIKITTPSTLEMENNTNPFLRCSMITLPHAHTALEVFTALRNQRNNF